MNFKPGDIVKINDQVNSAVVKGTFKTEVDLFTNFQVLLAGENIETYRGKEAGVVIRILDGEVSFPYVWNENRFVLVGHQKIG